MNADCPHSRKRHQHAVKERGWKTETWRVVRCIACDAFIREVHVTTIFADGSIAYHEHDIPLKEEAKA